MKFKKIGDNSIYLFRYASPDRQELMEKGEIYCFIRAKSTEESRKAKVETLMKIFWDGLVEEYNYCEKEGVLNCISKAIKAGSSRLRDLIKKDPNYKDSGIDLDLSVVVVKGQNVYMHRIGEIFLLLWRDGVYKDIGNYFKKFRKDSGSLVIENDDVLVMGSVEDEEAKPKEELVAEEYDFSVLERVLNQTEEGGLVAFSYNESKLESQRAAVADRVDVNIGLADEKDEVDSVNAHIGGKEEVLPVRETLKDRTEKILRERNLMLEEQKEEEDQSESVQIAKDSEKEEIEPYEKDEPKKDEEHTVEQVNKLDKAKVRTYKPKTVSTEVDNEKIMSSVDQIKEHYDEANEEYKKKEKEKLEDFKKVNETMPMHSIRREESDSQKKIDLTSKKIEQRSPNEVDKVGFKAKYGEYKEKVLVFFDNVRDRMEPVLTKIRPALQKVWGIIKNAFSSISSVVTKGLGRQFGTKPWYKKLSARVSQLKMRSGSPSIKGTKVDGYRLNADRNRRYKFLLVALLTVAIVFGGYKWTQAKAAERAKRDELNTQLESAEELLNEAEKLALTDRQAAQLNLYDAEIKVEEAEKLVQNDDDKGNVLGVQEKLISVEDRVNMRRALKESDENVVIYLDGISTFGSDSKLTDLTHFSDDEGRERIYVVDNGEKAVYQVNLYDKDVKKVPDNSSLIKDPLNISAATGGIYVYDRVSGLLYSPFNESMENQPFERVTGLDGDTLAGRGITDLAIWTSKENAYFMSQEDKAMLKSTNYSDAYGLPTIYVSNENFDTGEDLLGDESGIYIINSEDSIGVRAYRWDANVGRMAEVNIDILGVYPEFSNLTAGYTFSGAKNVYLYDVEDSRVIVLNKVEDSLQYIMKEQLVYRGERDDAWEKVQDLVSDEREEYLYMVDGVRVWRITL